MLMYFVSLDATTGRLLALDMTPLEIKRFRLHKAEDLDAHCLRNMLHREGRQLGTQVTLGADNRLALQWR